MSVLRQVTVFRDLPEPAIQRLEQAGTAIEPRPDTQVFSSGDPADAVYAIVGGAGRVRISAFDHRSKVLMAEVFRQGDVFGEIGVIDSGTRTAEAVADGRVRLFRIGAAGFRSVLWDTPALGVNLCRLLSHRLRRTFTLLEDATFETLEVRLARQVLYLAEVDGRRTEDGLQLAGRLRQTDLADLLGGTVRSIITILNAWRASGVVAYDGRRAQLTILDEAHLRALVGRAP